MFTYDKISMKVALPCLCVSIFSGREFPPDPRNDLCHRRSLLYPPSHKFLAMALVPLKRLASFLTETKKCSHKNIFLLKNGFGTLCRDVRMAALTKREKLRIHSSVTVLTPDHGNKPHA